eukprot:5157880-Prymnesium_polylepis.1
MLLEPRLATCAPGDETDERRGALVRLVRLVRAESASSSPSSASSDDETVRRVWPRGGAVACLGPRTGEALALPSHEPSWLTSRLADEERALSTLAPRSRPCCSACGRGRWYVSRTVPSAPTVARSSPFALPTAVLAGDPSPAPVTAGSGVACFSVSRRLPARADAGAPACASSVVPSAAVHEGAAVLSSHCRCAAAPVAAAPAGAPSAAAFAGLSFWTKWLKSNERGAG